MSVQVRVEREELPKALTALRKRGTALKKKLGGRGFEIEVSGTGSLEELLELYDTAAEDLVARHEAES